MADDEGIRLERRPLLGALDEDAARVCFHVNKYAPHAVTEREPQTLAANTLVPNAWRRTLSNRLNNFLFLFSSESFHGIQTKQSTPRS